jgi:adenosylhomocysteine nucleosidase
MREAGRIFVCGAGEAAGAAMKARLARGEVGLVVLAGFCGALDPSLSAGSLILSREVLMEGADPLAPDADATESVRKRLHLQNAAFVSSRLLTVAEPAGDPREKTDLWNVHGAGGVDMETYHVARACHDAGVPWIAIRAVLDPARRTLPRAVRAWQQESDEAAIRRDALRRPQDWPRYAALALDLRKAARALHQQLPGVVASVQLPPASPAA